MNKDFDIKVTIKMLETMAQLGVFMSGLNNLFIDKGIYTEEELDSYCSKVEKEDEDLQQLRQTLAFLKVYSNLGSEKNNA